MFFAKNTLALKQQRKSVEKTEHPQRNFPQQGGIGIICCNIAVFVILDLTKTLVAAAYFYQIFFIDFKIASFKTSMLYPMARRSQLAAKKGFTHCSDFRVRL